MMKRTVSTLLLSALVILTVAACSRGPNGPGPGQSGAMSGYLVYPGALPEPESAAALPLAADPLDASVHAELGGVGKGQAEVVPGEVIVFFEDGVRAQSLGGAFAELSVVRSISYTQNVGTLYKAEGLDGPATIALAAELSSTPGVRSAIPNWQLYSFKTPNDAGFEAQWHYGAMNLPAAWDVEDGTSSPVVVAVVDTGYVDHPDLLDNLIGGYDFVSDRANGGDGDGRDTDPFDEGGESDYHGSHVAGTIAALTNNGNGVAGVSWGAKVVVVRVLGVQGTGSFDDIMDGVAWAAGVPVGGVPQNPNPARVINMSLGADIGQACPDEISTFFRSLANDGVIVVVAAGNENVDARTTFPANCDGVITVGATGPQGTRAPYSNYGNVIDVMAAGGDVTQSFSAGGQTYPAGVLSTIALEENGRLTAGYAFYQGTSMASPHIAGIVALMLAKEPSLDFNTVMQRLQASAAPLSASQCGGYSNACGAGLVDARKALQASGGGTPPPPGPTPPPPPQTGRLTTYVAAFYCWYGNCYSWDPFDLDRSVLVEVPVRQNLVPFQIRGLEPGVYMAAAWQDLNGNDIVDDGEPFGVYGMYGGNDTVSIEAGRNEGGIFIFMDTAVTLSNSQATRDEPLSDAGAADYVRALQELANAY